MADDAVSLQLRSRYRGTAGVIRDRTKLYLEGAWSQVAANPSDETMARFVARAVPAVEGAQYQTAVATDVYLAQLEAAELEIATPPVGVARADYSTEALRGVDGETVWSRPGSAVWRDLAAGADMESALRTGIRRTRELVDTNLQLAHTHASQDVLSGKDTCIGYQRVPGRGRTCALCLLASTRQYHREDLMPIHVHCHCTVDPIYLGGEAREFDIEPDHLPAARQLVKGATGTAAITAETYEAHVAVHDHGEMGPVLAVKGHDFTGPSDLARAGT